MQELVDAVDELLHLLRSNSKLASPVLEQADHGSGPRCESLLDDVPRELHDRILSLSHNLDRSDDRACISRSVGAMVGMAIADGIGHNFEFLPACDKVGGEDGDGPRFEHPKNSRGVLHKPLNVFELKPGQWTDDASMGLCLADSVLMTDGFDGSHCRILFFNWWNNGLNNAFKFDDSRNKKSVGLGANISKSLKALQKYPHEESTVAEVPPRYEPPGGNQDSGNGSLMRLCPIPIFYAHTKETARRVAYESSLTTHPGPLAAEACAFVSSLIVACIHRPEQVGGKEETAKEFLDQFATAYQTRLRQEMEAAVVDGEEGNAKTELYRLLSSSEPDESTERCWNWKNDTGDGDTTGLDTDRTRNCCWSKLWQRKQDQASTGLGVEQTLKNRGHTYNGYKVSDRYFASFSLDALAMALYCVRSTTSFNEAIVRCINFLGDADTTAAIAAQIAGALYGVDAIQAEWKHDLEKWDGGGGFELRAVCLAVSGRKKALEEDSVDDGHR